MIRVSIRLIKFLLTTSKYRNGKNYFKSRRRSKIGMAKIQLVSAPQLSITNLIYYPSMLGKTSRWSLLRWDTDQPAVLITRSHCSHSTPSKPPFHPFILSNAKSLYLMTIFKFLHIWVQRLPLYQFDIDGQQLFLFFAVSCYSALPLLQMQIFENGWCFTFYICFYDIKSESKNEFLYSDELFLYSDASKSSTTFIFKK